MVFKNELYFEKRPCGRRKKTNGVVTHTCSRRAHSFRGLGRELPEMSFCCPPCKQGPLVGRASLNLQEPMSTDNARRGFQGFNVSHIFLLGSESLGWAQQGW